MDLMINTAKQLTKQAKKMTDFSQAQLDEIKAMIETAKAEERSRILTLAKNAAAWFGIGSLGALGGLGLFLWTQLNGAAEAVAEKTAKRVAEEHLTIPQVIDIQNKALDAIVTARASSLSQLKQNEENLARVTDLLAAAKRQIDLASESARTARSDAADLSAKSAQFQNLFSTTAGISDLATKLANDKDFSSRVGGQLALPKGIVVPFSPSGDANCPQGWSLYEPAIGRFVVGAGQRRKQDENAFWNLIGGDRRAIATYRLGQIGGEEQHLLSIAELPSHTHAVYRHAAEMFPGARGPGYTNGAGSEDSGTLVRDNSQTGVTGANQPHSILPPFIALYPCIKD